MKGKYHQPEVLRKVFKEGIFYSIQIYVQIKIYTYTELVSIIQWLNLQNQKSGHQTEAIFLFTYFLYKCKLNYILQC